MAGRPFRIVEAIYPGMTQLDFTAPHTVFSRIPNTETIVASEAGGPVESEGGLVFAGTRRLAEIDRCDMIFFPGGLAVTEAINNAAFMAQARRLAAGARYLTSVCTGSLVLAAAGLLTRKRAACHWAWRDMLTLFGAIPDADRVVRDGNIITGGGVTAGMDFALVVAAERKALEEFLSRMPFRVPLNAKVSAISAGERQKCEILKQLYLQRRFLILD